MSGRLKIERDRIETADIMIPSGTPGIELLLRNKKLPETVPSDSTTALFVHGATLSNEAGFDLALGGYSWMDVMAMQGFDAWFVNVRGYGGSTRPEAMSRPASENPPLARTREAVGDYSAGVEHILKARGLQRLNAMGWSWGTAVCGAYTAANNAKVRKLALVAPLWLRNVANTSDPGGAIGAYRSVPIDAAEARWRAGVPEGEFEKLVPEEWLRQWRDGLLASDPEGAAMTPPVLRAPNGTVMDVREYWSAGKPFYDPSEITVPVLQVHAEWDNDIPLDIARAYFAQLTGAPYRRWVEIGEGTHSVLLEKNRWQLFDAVAAFLREEFEPE